jgi:Flp pilus assembly protein TadG
MVTSRAWQFCRDRRGVSAIEFAIIAPIAATVMLAAFDLGNAAQQQIALREAVRTGGQYAIHFPTNPSDIRAAVTSALPSGWTLSNPGGVPVVTCQCGTYGTYSGVPVVTCQCGTYGTYNDCSAPPATCTDPMLLTVTATMAYTALEPWVTTAIPNLSASYVVRFH